MRITLTGQPLRAIPWRRAPPIITWPLPLNKRVHLHTGTHVHAHPPHVSCAGELSGGQRRKLSVAISFLGHPSVVFLDEPTSGMDPYSRRFTWEVVRRRARSAAIVLTTHSMEEADTLADDIAIMAQVGLSSCSSGVGVQVAVVMVVVGGYMLCMAWQQALAGSAQCAMLGAVYRDWHTLTGCAALVLTSLLPRPALHHPQGTVAARGTSLELKSRHGAGYTLAMVLEPGADLEQLAPLVAGHVPGAELLSAAAAEASFRCVAGCLWTCVWIVGKGQGDALGRCTGPVVLY